MNSAPDRTRDDPEPGHKGWTEIARAQRSAVHGRTWVHVPADGADQAGFLDAGPLRVVQNAMARTYAEPGTQLGWTRDHPDVWVLLVADDNDKPEDRANHERNDAPKLAALTQGTPDE